MSDIHSHLEVKIGSERTFGLVVAAALAILALIPLVHGAGIRRGVGQPRSQIPKGDVTFAQRAVPWFENTAARRGNHATRPRSRQSTR